MQISPTTPPGSAPTAASGSDACLRATSAHGITSARSLARWNTGTYRDAAVELAWQMWQKGWRWMDIATSIAWDNWRAAWCAAHAALNNGKTRDLAYERTVSIWLTAGASDREKFAYRDGHDRGWRNAVEAIAIRKEA